MSRANTIAFLNAVEEVLRISDRQHVAWDAAKAGLADAHTRIAIEDTDDDALRFACRCLEGNPSETDKLAARAGLMAIRARMRT
jgi:hypothetical protein